MDNKIAKVEQKRVSKKATIITASVIVILIAATLIGIVIYKNLEKKVIENEPQIDIYGVDIYDEVPDTKEVEQEIAIDNEKQEEKTDEVKQDEVDKVDNSTQNENKQEQNNTTQVANNNTQEQPKQENKPTQTTNNNNTQVNNKTEQKPVEQPKQEQQVSKPVEQPAQTQQPEQKPVEVVKPTEKLDETNDGSTVVDAIKTNKFVRFQPNMTMANKLKTIALANMSDYWKEHKDERGWNVIVSSKPFDEGRNFFTYHLGEFEGICNRTAIGNLYVYAVDEIWTNGDYEYVFQTRCYHN